MTQMDVLNRLMWLEELDWPESDRSSIATAGRGASRAQPGHPPGHEPLARLQRAKQPARRRTVELVTRLFRRARFHA